MGDADPKTFECIVLVIGKLVLWLCVVLQTGVNRLVESVVVNNLYRVFVVFFVWNNGLLTAVVLSKTEFWWYSSFTLFVVVVTDGDFEGTFLMMILGCVGASGGISELLSVVLSIVLKFFDLSEDVVWCRCCENVENVVDFADTVCRNDARVRFVFATPSVGDEDMI